MRKSNNGLVMPEGIFFYYLRVPASASNPPRADGVKRPKLFSRPLACVCFGRWAPNTTTRQPIWIRGISICSHSENFNKKEARRRAYARFLKAKGTRKSSDQVVVVRTNGDQTPPSVVDYVQMMSVDRNWPWDEEADRLYKSRYDAQLTEREKKIVEVAEAKAQKQREVAVERERLEAVDAHQPA